MTEIVNLDVLEWCREYKGGKFHALLCDPPYELGFMGKDWDKSGIAFSSQTWRLLAEHLHNGAFLFVFASSRGYHRVACALEDAGLILHPTLFLWANGAGFPKATRIDTQIDKALGLENSDDAKEWQSHRYGLQALKPAIEPILVAQKPYSGKLVECINKTGAGALNIDGSRILTNENITNHSRSAKSAKSKGIYGDSKAQETHQTQGQVLGRWPSNFILQHSLDCECVKGDEWLCMEDCPVRKLDEQSGNRKSNLTYKKGGKYEHTGKGKIRHWNVDYEKLNKYAGEEGGASRFFYNSDWIYEVEEKIIEADNVIYCSKAGKNERNEGLDELKDCEDREKERYGFSSDIKNFHPTVKPIKLINHLSNLLLPPDKYKPRRILIPFSGSGSEIIGAFKSGWEDIVGIEIRKEYVEIAKKRLEYWQKLISLQKDKEEQCEQLDLFAGEKNE